jgi:uncharacterized protein (TIGR03435 family)
MLVALTCVLGAQETSFEVASIRPSPDVPPAQGVAGVHITQQQVRFSYLSIRDYLTIGYGVPVQRVSGPDWINSTRFDIVATFPAGATPEQFPEMVKNLLRERFKLKAHLESRESAVYVLEIARGGLKLSAVADDTPPAGPLSITSSGGPDGVMADLGQGASLALTSTRFEAKKVTMKILTDTLGRFMDRPILDQTKLDARYDVAFPITHEDYMPMLVRSAVNGGVSLPPQAMALLDTPSIGSVVDGLKSLGLALEARRAPLDVLVVDSLDRTPTEN